MSTATLSSLPPEIKLLIFHYTPDLSTLKSIIIASRDFYDLFKVSSTSSDSILLRCLYHEIGYGAAHQAVLYSNALRAIHKVPIKGVSHMRQFLHHLVNDTPEVHSFPWKT